MPAPRPRRRARLTALVSLVLAVGGIQLLAPQAAHANATATGLVISEVYGGGGNSGSTWKNDFIELYNPTDAAISVDGWSVQGRSATNTAVASNSGSQLNVTTLAGSVPRHGYYLVKEAAQGGGTKELPTADATGAMAIAAGGWQIWLSDGAVPLDPPDNDVLTTPMAGIIDFVGGATTATSFETAKITSAPAAATGITRNVGVDTDNNAADFTVVAPSPTNAAGETQAPGVTIATVGAKSGNVGTQITSFTATATGGSGAYTWSATGFPPGVGIASSTGVVSGTPTTAGTYNPVITAADTSSPTPLTDTETFAFTISDPNAIRTIADIQGTGPRSTYAPATNATSDLAANGQTVTTQGVITALYKRGYNSAGADSCGFCGFYLQTGGSGGATDATTGASDAIFVYGNPGFLGKNSVGDDLAVGQSVKVTGTISEFASSSTATTESTTELTAAAASNIVPVSPALAPVVMQTTLPATYAEREAHEGELFQPSDLVITDTFNFETFGEFGLAAGGKPLVQPTEKCVATDSTCVTAAQQTLRDKGWFTEDGTNVTFMNGESIYDPRLSKNTDIPYPFITKTKSARVGAGVTFPSGGVLDFRNRKWYVQVPHEVLSTHNGTPVAGDDVLQIADTRPKNAAPAPVGGDLKIATYNVENFFNLTGQAFAAANPYYDCSYDYDRDGNPILTFECESPQGTPDQFDPVTGAPTHYDEGLVNAPRGAGTTESLNRQTAKIVRAINGLDADVVSLEELGNPNKLRTGVTQGPLDPPNTSAADGGLGTPIAWRDESINYLVEHLNAAVTDGDPWAFVASPEESTDATTVAGMCSKKNPKGTDILPKVTAGNCSWASGQDVIRSGFLYKKATVVPVGQSDLDLPGSSAPSGADNLHVPSPFDNAREPLAQFFKPVGHPNSDGFAVIVNHFKSKGDADAPAGPAAGDNANSATVGAFNGDRTRQADELLRFANEFAAKWQTDKVFLVGDFNAYTGEDPVQTILNDPNDVDSLDFGLVTSADTDDLTYVFTANVTTSASGTVGYGAAGSLDHVFASAGVQSAITKADVWEINSNEPAVYNYSRFNNNATDFWDDTVPFGGSDHNPEIIGINVAANTHPVRDIQIIGSNDFHGRLLGSSSDGGAAQLAAAVKSLKSIWGDDSSTFVAAGDLIGASTFESSIQKDKPTLEALNEAGLEVSAVGNHEFDQGYHDLIDRVMKPQSASNPDGIPGGIDWQYIGSNVVYTTDPDGSGPLKVGDTVVLPTYEKEFPGTNGGPPIKIGFVGAVTEDLLSLVNPDKMQGVGVTPIAAAVNQYATTLKGRGDDLVVLLVHEGAPSTDCDTMTTDDSAFAELLGDIDPTIDAVISGHTHLEYACQFDVPEWVGKPITQRPVVSAGQYGVALDQLVYSFDQTGEPTDVVVTNVGVKGPGSTLFSYPEDPATKAIVDAAVAAAVGPGQRVLGRIEGPFERARLSDGVTENRGGESTLGNLVAEIQRWATPSTDSNGIEPAQIAFMNPGGLRTDLLGQGTDYPRDVNYRSASDVQPFANTLVNMDMTGAQIRAVLEQQWQRDAQGNVPSRPFLRLGTSKGFTYTYTESTDQTHSPAKLGHVTAMYLDGEPIIDTDTYSVTMNSFLAAGGDNFTAFKQGADKRDTGITDLQAQVDYMAQEAGEHPLDVDYAQHAVRVTFPNGATPSYAPGATIAFDVASLAMTGPDDLKDTTLSVQLGGQEIGTAAVTNTVGSDPNDEAGKAVVSVTLPAALADGTNELHLVGNQTGTDVTVPFVADDGLPDATVSATDTTVKLGETAHVPVTVTATTGTGTPTGTVTVKDGATVLGTATLTNGAATVDIPAASLPAIGAHQLTASYDGGQASTYSPSADTFTLTVGKATSATVGTDVASSTYGQAVPVTVTVSGAGPTPTGTVTLLEGLNLRGTGTLDGSGHVTITVPAGTLSVGSHTLVATYGGDVSHEDSTDQVSVTVGKADATITASDVTVPVGQTGTATITVTASGVTPNGSVTLKNGSTVIAGPTALTNGTATFALPALADGTVVTVDYAGDGNVNAQTGSFTVHKGAKATPTVTVSDATLAYGATAPVTVQVTGPVAATGTVTLKEGSTALGSGALSSGSVTITLAAQSLAVGSHTLSAEYTGNGDLNGAARTFTVTVTKAAAAISATGGSHGYGTAGTVSVQVTAAGVTPTGTVVVKDGGTTVGSGAVTGGSATITLPAGSLSPGRHILSAEYSGDGAVDAATTTLAVTVTKAASTVEGKVKPKDPKKNQRVKLTVIVQAANGVAATGQVKVKVDGDGTTVRLKDGRITLNLGKFGKGTHKVKISYLGSDTVEDGEDTVKFSV